MLALITLAKLGRQILILTPQHRVSTVLKDIFLTLQGKMVAVINVQRIKPAMPAQARVTVSRALEMPLVTPHVPVNLDSMVL